MKYKNIKVGDEFEFLSSKETVISKSDKYKIITTINDKFRPTSWKEEELYMLRPIKPIKPLPEEGLFVSNSGIIIYRTGKRSGYGFGLDGNYIDDDNWSFISRPKVWKLANSEQKEQFVKMLKKECELRGLFENTKLEKHADGTLQSDPEFMKLIPTFNLTRCWNRNGQIFNRGKFATPRKEETLELEKIMQDTKKDLKYYRKNAEEDYLTTPISVLRYITEMEKTLALTQVEKSSKNAGDFNIDQTESGIIILIPKN